MCFPWFLLLVLGAAAYAAEFRVGFASADVTPPVGWRRAGNYTELISTGVNDPLMSRAMVVQEGATTFAFVGNDLSPVPRDLTDLARIRASQLTGIPVANIVIAATHTHGGPEYLGPLRQFLLSAILPRARAAAVLTAVVFLQVVTVPSAEPVVFHPAYAPGPADNPLKGFVPYAGQGRKFPHSLEFNYLPLASMMIGPTNFNWLPMEQLLDGIASRGCQSVFRIYLEYPRQPSGVPEYLVQAGVKMRAWTNTNTQPLPPALDHTPDYEDPRLRAALTNFIAALGARYDGDPRLGFITAGLLGTWGEWHCHPHSEWFASKTVQAEVMDAYEAAFKRTPVLLRYPAGDNDHAHASNARRNLGYHDDSFAWGTLDTGRKDDDWFYLAALRKAGPAALDRWRTAPIGGEIRPELWSCLWKSEGCTTGQDFAQCVRDTHVSWLMDSSTSSPFAADERESALAAARSLGYELQVVQATVSLAGRALEVSVTITNRGVAPFYAGWPVRLLAVGSAGGESVAELPFALNTLLPAATATRSVTLHLAKVSSGEATLLLGIPNPLQGGRPLRFANAEQDRDRPGWLTLGKIIAP